MGDEAKIIDCPTCKEALVFPRGHGPYCEYCGWPDEDFGGEWAYPNVGEKLEKYQPHLQFFDSRHGWQPSGVVTATMRDSLVGLYRYPAKLEDRAMSERPTPQEQKENLADLILEMRDKIAALNQRIAVLQELSKTDVECMRRQHAELLKQDTRIATLEAAQTEIDGCFEAALIEGWIEALADGDIDRIRDIYNRRIEYVRGIVARTVAPPAQPSGKEG